MENAAKCRQNAFLADLTFCNSNSINFYGRNAEEMKMEKISLETKADSNLLLQIFSSIKMPTNYTRKLVVLL